MHSGSTGMSKLKIPGQKANSGPCNHNSICLLCCPVRTISQPALSTHTLYMFVVAQ